MTENELIKLTDLVANFMDAKEDERYARDMRIIYEKKIAALVPTPEKGQTTITLGDVKLTVKRGLNYKADLEGIDAMFGPGFPNKNLFLASPIKSKTVRELDISGYEWYRKEYPDIFKQLAEYVEVKPKKVAIEVKLVKE